MFGKSPKLQWSAIHGDQTNLDQFGSPKYVRSKDNNREGSQRAGSGLRDRHLLGYFIPSACRPVCGGTKSQLENFRVRPAGFGPLVHCSCEPCVAHFATSEGKGGSVESRIGRPSPPNWLGLLCTRMTPSIIAKERRPRGPGLSPLPMPRSPKSMRNWRASTRH